MKIIVCGSRYNPEKYKKQINRVFKKLKSNTIIIHGACRGVDQLAGDIATGFQLEVIEYPADWKKYGKAAGPLRNKEMLKENPKYVFAFHDKLYESKGTKNMIELAKKENIIVYLMDGKKCRKY
jgi:hypothetical protein